MKNSQKSVETSNEWLSCSENASKDRIYRAGPHGSVIFLRVILSKAHLYFGDIVKIGI